MKKPKTFKEWYDSNPLEEWRKRKQYTRAQVAAMLGISNTAYANWIMGTSRPGTENMKSIATLIETPDVSDKWDKWMENFPA